MHKRCLAALFLPLLMLPALAQAYSFVLTNNTGTHITKVEVSEDGESWGYFDIGNGLDGGTSSNMEWDPNTDDSSCEWQVRATYADGSVADPATFDFCEEDLEIQFDE